MRILVTAGPTREPIDAVRFISNRSSGRMGIAIAQEAAKAGHDVTLLLGPVLMHGSLHEKMRVYRFGSSAELKQMLEAHFSDCDVLVMTAAVADYRTEQASQGKIKRQSDAELTLRLQPTPDLVAAVASTKRPGQSVVAFALEEPLEMESRALSKMKLKGVDAVVANPLGTMEGEQITPLWLTAVGGREEPGRMSKDDFAAWLVDRLQGL